MDFDLNAMEINQVMAAATKAVAVPGVKEAALPVAMKELEKKVLRETGKRNMFIGGLVCGIGLLVTFGTLAAAEQGARRYMIAWGAILFGGVQFCRGFLQRLD